MKIDLYGYLELQASNEKTLGDFPFSKYWKFIALDPTFDITYALASSHKTLTSSSSRSLMSLATVFYKVRISYLIETVYVYIILKAPSIGSARRTRSLSTLSSFSSSYALSSTRSSYFRNASILRTSCNLSTLYARCIISLTLVILDQRRLLEYLLLQIPNSTQFGCNSTTSSLLSTGSMILLLLKSRNSRSISISFWQSAIPDLLKNLRCRS